MNNSPEAQSERELVASALAGCRDGFAELVRRHMTSLQYFLGRHNQEVDVEDLVQETFLRAYRSLDRYDPRWRFSTWLFTIARRLSLDEARRRRRPGATPNDPLPRSFGLSDDEGRMPELVDADQPSPAEIAESRESRRNIWAAARSVLREEEWTSLWLFYVEEMSVKEIAQVQNKKTSAVKTMLHRARKRLAPHVNTEDNPVMNDSRGGRASSQDDVSGSRSKTKKSEQKMSDACKDLPLAGRESGISVSCEGNLL